MDKVIELVHAASETQTCNASPTCFEERSEFMCFATQVIFNAKFPVAVPTLLVALLYISRAKPQEIVTESKWAYEHVFLGALMISHKVRGSDLCVCYYVLNYECCQYINDGAMRPRHWALCTTKFGIHDLSRIEREFLIVLDYRLGVTETELLDLALICSSSPRTSSNPPHVLHPQIGRAHV